MSKASSGFGKFITWLLVILLVLCVAVVAAYFFMRGQGMTYYIEYNGKRYFGGTDGGSLTLLTGETHEFSVKSLTGGEVNYSVKVMSNGANNFRFAVGDELHTFYSGNIETDDYSQVFGLEKSSDGFSLTLPESYTVEQAIETKYGEAVSLFDELSNGVCYFVIAVSVENSAVDLWFAFSTHVTDITLDPPSIVF